MFIVKIPSNPHCNNILVNERILHILIICSHFVMIIKSESGDYVSRVTGPRHGVPRAILT
jgi:hypothetical protein